MNDSNAKQQIVEKIKASSNILVTVSRNPSVDELSAALGVTLLLNKMKKHATAVFSGAIPPAITFLDPEKTFENTVDSLRDFIIALDKEKADHLRYKVDGDVVKIFITPYRTTITNEDLEFSQGDYNVELVLGLGVKNQDDLDGALTAHGRILHDATVATMSLGDAASELGSIDWREQNASSFSEMLVSLSDGLKGEKGLLDEQIATAFLTGIVAATDRFSNNRTSSKVMTIAAQLMSAGANQQLIATKLEEANAIGPNAPAAPSSDGMMDIPEGASTKVEKPTAQPEAKKDDGSLTITHEKEGTLDEVAAATAAENQQAATKEAREELAKQSQPPQEPQAAHEAEQKLAQQLATVTPMAVSNRPSVAELQKDIAAASADVAEAATETPQTVSRSPVGTATVPSQGAIEPAMGGTLNATTEQAAEDSRRAMDDERNRTILTHGSGHQYVGNSMPTYQSPINAASQPASEAPIDLFAAPSQSQGEPETAPTVYAQPIQPPVPTPAPLQTLADIDAQNRTPHEEARAAVNAAFGAVPYTPPVTDVPAPGFEPHQAPSTLPTSMSLPPLPPMPDFSTLPPLPPAPGSEQPQPMGALPPEKLEEMFGSTPVSATPPPQPSDPGQFKIPGQS